MNVSDKIVHDQLTVQRSPDYSLDANADQVDIRQAFLAIWSQKYLILICTLLASGVFYATVNRLEPLYTAKASVMLDPRSVQVLASDNLMADLNLNSPMLDTEAAVLRSNMLLQNVVEELGPGMLAPIDPALREPTLFSRIWGQMKSVPQRVLAAEPEIHAALTPEDIEAQRDRRLVGTVRKSTKVWREGQSYLISVASETPSPELSQRIANTIISVYIQRQIDHRNAVVREATSFLSERVEEMRTAVEQAEARVEDYRSQQVAEAGASSNTVERQLLELSTQLALAQADLAQARAKQDRIESVIVSSGIEQGAELITTPFILSLRQQIADADRREADLATRYSPEYPERAAVRSEQQELRAQLSREVEAARANIANDVEVAEARVASIRHSVSEMEARFSKISRANLQLRQFEREADALRENFQSMLTRLNETRASEQLQRADARQVERAVASSAPSSPRVILFTALGATLGFALGLMLTFYRHVTRSGYVQPHEIEQDLRQPVTASLVKGEFKSRRSMLKELHDAPFGLMAERLRQLRVEMGLMSPTHEGICAVVTSALPAEGKTSTVVGMAWLEGFAKRRCVILDLDLRRSALGRELGYDSECDVADVLQRGAPLEGAIQRIEGLGFDLLSTRGDNPGLIDELDTAVLADLIAEMKKRYDLVLIDSPPVLLVSDAMRLSRVADLVLLLIRQRKTNRKAVREAFKRLRASTNAPVGVAMTMAEVRAESEIYGYTAEYEAKRN